MHKIPKSKRWADLDVSLNARQNSKAYPNVSRDNVEYGGLKKINICGIYTVKTERKKICFLLNSSTGSTRSCLLVQKRGKEVN